MYSYFCISGVVNMVTSILLGIFILFKDPKSKINRIFAFFCLCVAAWSFGYIFWPLASDKESTLFWFRILHIGSTYASVAYLHFVCNWLDIFKKNKWIIFIGYCLSTAILISIFTPYFIKDIVPKFEMRFWAVPGIIYHFYLLLFFSYALYSTYLLLKALKTLSGQKRLQAKFMLIGLVLAYIGGSSNYFLWYNINIPPYLNILASGYVIITAYAILAYKLFDIRVVIKKTFIYSTLLTFVFGVYVLVVLSFTKLFGATSVNQTLIPGILAALFIALGYDPLRRWLIRVTENKLFQGEYKPQEVLNNLSKILSSVLDLDEALDNIVHIIVQNMRLDKAAAIVLSQDPENKILIVKRVKSTGYEGKDIKLKEKNGLIEYFDRYIKKQKRETGAQSYIEEPEAEFKKTKLIRIEERIKIKPIITDELDRMLELSGEKNQLLNGVVKELRNLKAAVSMPIIVKGNLIGIFILGNKKSGDIFNGTDLNLLTIIANQTATAIEKARFYEEDQLKSEFVSIASHELLTPTSAIEGYLSMILEEDMGKVDKRARGYLEKVYESSQRLAKLVKDLLNVSRIEGGRIMIQSKNFDIRDLAKTVMSEMEPQAREKKLEFKVEGIDRDIPEVWADSERAHQVLVNLVSNSIKYTEKGTVTVRVDYSLSTVRVSVIDTGVGIKEDEIPHLFEKFYRASNADNQGAQGTGLGLYISKNIVELMGGMMNLDSEYGKGTTVSFSLPRGKTKTEK